MRVRAASDTRPVPLRWAGGGAQVIVRDYPKGCKAFYMRINEARRPPAGRVRL